MFKLAAFVTIGTVVNAAQWNLSVFTQASDGTNFSGGNLPINLDNTMTSRAMDEAIRQQVAAWANAGNTGLAGFTINPRDIYFPFAGKNN